MPAAVAIEYDTNRRLVVVFDEIAVVGCDSVAVLVTNLTAAFVQHPSFVVGRVLVSVLGPRVTEYSGVAVALSPCRMWK